MMFVACFWNFGTLTPDKLKAFARIHVNPAFPDGNPRYAEAIGGKV
jgi:hypothetical protein